MNIRLNDSGIGGIGRFFYASGKRIIGSVATGYVKLRGQVFGGVDCWRDEGGGCVGSEGFAGVGVEQDGGAQGAGGGEVAALEGGAEGLAGDAKSGVGVGGAAVAADQCGQGGISHVVLPARRRVAVYVQRAGDCQMIIYLIRQFVGGERVKGQSVFSMPRAGA